MVESTRQKVRTTAVASKTSTKYFPYVAFAGITLLSLIIYLKGFSNGFVWDDSKYILGNPYIKDITFRGLIDIFLNFSNDNYAPITDLINAVLVSPGGLNANNFHLAAMIFHIANSILVYKITFQLRQNVFLSIVTSLLFTVLPVQVESVAWISAISTLYFTFFFLWSLYFFIRFTNEKKYGYYWLAFCLFLLSALSKAFGVVLPLIFLLVGYFYDKKLTTKHLVRLIPFIVLSIGLIVLTIFLKDNQGGLQSLGRFSVFERIGIICYSYTTALVHLILPFKLSAFYPYPSFLNSRSVTIYIALYAVIVLILLSLLFMIRKYRGYYFGFAFFTFTMVTGIQLIPVGGAITADRYLYLPSIGILFLFAEFLVYLGTKFSLYKVSVIPVILIIGYSLLSSQRVGVWKDELILWTDVINKYPDNALAYNNRGTEYLARNDYNNALNDFTQAIKFDSVYTQAYQNRGTLYFNLNEDRKAGIDFSKAIELDSKDPVAFFNRGSLRLKLGQTDSAVADFSRALAINNSYTEALYNRAKAFQESGNFPSALTDYKRTSELDPQSAAPHNNLGIIYFNLKQFDKALSEYSQAIAKQKDYYRAYINRGNVYYEQGLYDTALADYTTAIEINSKAYEAYAGCGNIYFAKADLKNAIHNYTKAIDLNPSDYLSLYYRGSARYYEKDFEGACNDMKAAAKLGYEPAKQSIANVCR